MCRLITSDLVDIITIVVMMTITTQKQYIVDILTYTFLSYSLTFHSRYLLKSAAQIAQLAKE